MALKSINPTQTNAWQKLTQHFAEIKDVRLKKLFNGNPHRKEDFTINFNDFSVDYSKNNITQETISHLIELANEVDLQDAIEKCFRGEKINETEERALLHSALRTQKNNPILVNGIDVLPEIKNTLSQIKTFTNNVVSGVWKGYTDKKITDIVNIGIGGSDLGPDMVVDALKYYKNHLNVHFVSNIDGDHVQEIIKKLNPETSLFVIVSKTFTTQETLTNATTIRKWFLESADEEAIKKHFVAYLRI